MIFEDKHGVRVEAFIDERVAFCAQGGGWSQNLPAQKFFDIFTPVKVERPLRPAFFSIDSAEWAVAGYHNGTRWNGWACPCFTMEQARVLAKLQDFGSIEYDEAADEWFSSYEGADELDRWKASTVNINGERVKVYEIGSGFWTWDAVEYGGET